MNALKPQIQQQRNTKSELRTLIDLTNSHANKKREQPVVDQRIKDKRKSLPTSRQNSSNSKQVLNHQSTIAQTLFKAQYQTVKQSQQTQQSQRSTTPRLYNNKHPTTQNPSLNKSHISTDQQPSLKRNPSKAETRYKDLPSPSFASSVQSSRGATDLAQINEVGCTGGFNTKRSSMGPLSHNSSVATINFNTNRSSSFISTNAVMQKIESTSQKVGAEISENQRLTKELMAQKKELQKQIDFFKSEFAKVKKETTKLKEEIPRFQESTQSIESKISHKRQKSFERIKEITQTKAQIRQLEQEKGSLLDRKEQMQQQLKVEGIRIEGLTQRVSEIKSQLTIQQREKEKLNIEISKQKKIVINQEKRLQTLVSLVVIIYLQKENNVKFYDNFEVTTSRMVGGDLTNRSIFN